MGQYFLFANLDKKEWISPIDFDNGAKEMEHSFVGNEYVGAVIKLLNNRWKGDRIIHIGDYGEEYLWVKSLPKHGKQELIQFRLEFGLPDVCDYTEENCTLFHYIDSYFEKIAPSKIKGKDCRYILVGNDKYIDRFDVKFGEIGYDEKPENAIYEWEKGKGILKVDPFVISISLSDGSGGSYQFEYGTIQDELHGCLLGQRFQASETLPKDRVKINLREIGAFELSELSNKLLSELNPSECFLTNEENKLVETAKLKQESIKEQTKGFAMEM